MELRFWSRQLLALGLSVASMLLVAAILPHALPYLAEKGGPVVSRAGRWVILAIWHLQGSPR